MQTTLRAAVAALGLAAAAAHAATGAGGPNEMRITNAQRRPITIGKFINGQSITHPSAAITLRPGQTGSLSFRNGEAGFVAQADANGHFQTTASRLEYEADADGRMKYPDVSYIDGRNAAISLTDGAKLHKGDKKTIAAGAPPDIVSRDSGGTVTITGWYDGSTPQMRKGGAYMQSRLGMSGAYLHPNDDRLPPDQNPMSATQSRVIMATFGPT
ncbi:MAG: hypothetical protein JOY63_03165 [Acetobacteraceae bacterium]|nr:hypothetical protein [Acetobacteraceae bacterium]